ncbi:segregation/condensation protein A [Clostridium sp. D2Q-14]|uniref:segregation and condensation protein A n=1 Tax=Anaeromonas gelatinilytica TaxID=2683194 RepID=UPI00193C0D13|nr:segregation/condensation protein A [Anaeromonas gelatinilytica]MBS4536234.1 segregation/condensation protein A [Anaeromonas gelatinilytica]
MKYNITLESFEGPFDLLYHLIEKEEVDIYDISIAKITEQYIDYLSLMEELDLEITSEFLIMAATLLEIKSKMLLPNTKIEGEQIEMEEADPREELIQRLIEYKKYKIAAEKFKKREEVHSKVFYKPREEIEIYNESDTINLEGLELKDLIKAFDNIIKKNINKKSSKEFHKIKREEITIDEAMNLIRNKLNLNKHVFFDELFENRVTRSNIISIFIGILELIKLKEIIIYQDNNFSNIKLRQI